MTANMHIRNSDDCVVTALPSAHVYGNVIMNSAISLASTLAVLFRFTEENALKSIQKYNATMFDGILSMCLNLKNE